MSKRVVTISDLTGEQIADGDIVSVIVKEHPTLDRAVKLEAASADVAGLEATKKDFVTLELVGASGDRETMTVELRAFSKLFKVDEQSALAGAEHYGEAPARRGRPRGAAKAAAKPKSDPAQLQAIREWARENGHEVADRGRIASEIREAYDAAH
jgi:hypothetical protein